MAEEIKDTAETESKKTRGPALIEIEVLRIIGITEQSVPGGCRNIKPGAIIKVTKAIAQHFSDVGAARIIL